MRPPFALACLAGLALADAPASWEAVDAAAAAACRALVPGPGEDTLKVNPFRPESYGLALVTLPAEGCTDRTACLVSKAAGVAEPTPPVRPLAA